MSAQNDRPVPSRVAIHEAGHCTMGWALGYQDPGPVTVVGADGLFGGVCLTGTPPVLPTPMDMAYGYATPLAVIPDRVRRYCESQVMLLLAGDAAEDLFDWWGFSPHESSDAVLTPHDLAAELPKGERTLLARVRARTEPLEGDAERVMSLLLAMHLNDLELAIAHRTLLKRETVRVLQLHSRALVHLAYALDSQGTLSGAAWTALLEESTLVEREAVG